MANGLLIAEMGIHSIRCDNNPTDQSGTVEMFVALGTVVTCLGVHPILVEVQSSIAEPPSAAQSTRWGVFLAYSVGAAYALTSSVVGYLAYGDCYEQNALAMAMPGKYGWVPVLANGLSLIDVVASVQLYAQPAIEDVVLVMAHYLSTFVPVEMKACSRWLWLVVAPTLVGLYGLIAHFLPEIGTICALLGGLSTIPLQFVAPSLIHMAAKPCAWRRCLFWPLVAIGLVLSATSLVAAVFALLDTLWYYF